MTISRRFMLIGFTLISLSIALGPLIYPFFMKTKSESADSLRRPPVSIAYVDVQKVFEGSNSGKAQITAFQKELTAKTAEVKRLNAQVQSMKNQLEGMLRQGNQRAVQSRLPAFQAAQKKLVMAQQEATEQLQKTQADVDKNFMAQLKTIMDQLRRDEHVDIILAYDPSKTLSADPKLDLTEKALMKYNQTFPLEAAAPAASSNKPSDSSETPDQSP